MYSNPHNMRIIKNYFEQFGVEVVVSPIEGKDEQVRVDLHKGEKEDFESGLRITQEYPVGLAEESPKENSYYFILDILF